MQQINLTLGTAGHIDHGKTALVKALTGCDTDRLKAEKERGMSIELGYAPCLIADKQVGIVDVPGHENFVKTMVAGAAGMDAVLLVVAADDGIMPQTREHMEILTLLNVRHGMVALTKIDRVDAARREQVVEELRGYLRGTFLESAPILPVSNVTNEGFDAFLEALWAMVGSITPKPADGVFRMPVERGFSAAGCGTVVAGVPVCGSIRLGAEVVLLPQSQPGRIRGIEVYGHAAETAMAGQCVALNVRGWDHHEIGRGNVVAQPGYFAPHEWFLCKLRLLPLERLLLKNGTEVKFHTGTSETVARIYSLEGNTMSAGGEWLVQLRTAAPLVVGPGDRFILRTNGPVRTVGGGWIVEPAEVRTNAKRPGVREDVQERADCVLDRARFLEYCLRHAEPPLISVAELARRAKLLDNQALEILTALQDRGIAIGFAQGQFGHREAVAGQIKRILEFVGQFHQRAPESPGLTVEELRQGVDLPRAALDWLLAMLRADGRLGERAGRLALATHQASFPQQDVLHLEEIEQLFQKNLFAPPGAEELSQRTGLNAPELERLIKMLCDNGRLVMVAPKLPFHADAVRRAGEIAREHFRKEPRLESVDFKYLLDTTRKFALPLLDYMDRIGVTRRVGNTRFLKAPK